MAGNAPVRVAVVGARGIGKHHAKWWTIEGARVCAFAGTSPESVAKTRAALVDLFGFDGAGYTRLEEMIEKERPDIVDVCSPPAYHGGHVRTALDAGCHVLCEKPFVYDPALPGEAILERARGLAALAHEKGLRLAVSTQYSMGARMFTRIWDETHPGERVTHYHGHLESPAKGRAPDPERVWLDLSPHPISVLMDAAPDGQVDWSTLRTTFNGYEALPEFDVRRPSGQSIRCLIVTRNALEPPLNIRHFKYNGYPFVVEGQNDAEGIYCARIETPHGHYLEPDMMRALIRAFLAGSPAQGIEASLANLDLMLRVRDFVRKGGHAQD